MRRTFALALGDYRNVARDSFLLMMLAVPLLLALLLRFAVPFAAEKLKSIVDLVPHYRFMLGLVLFFPGMLFGAVIGFLLLDERDEGVLDYMAVTPLSTGGYLRYRILAPTLVSFFMGIVLLPVAGIVAYPFWRTLPVILAASLSAPMLALFLASFAGNKVEGMALYKLTGLVLAGPVLANFVKSDFSYFGGLLPTFWVMKAFLEGYSGGLAYWLHLGGAFLSFAVVIRLMLGRFRKKIR